MIKKGSVFLLSTGEYSDYTVNAIFRALVDIDIDKLSEEFLCIHPDQRERYEAEFSKFINWLLNIKKIAEEIDYQEWFIGGCGTIEPELRKSRRYYMPEKVKT